MRKMIISIFLLLLPLLAQADQLQLRPDAPERYVVVKGDTLWDISAKFFNDPWKWPEIWGLNKDTIRDPHWIYPGDIVYLDRSTNTLRVNEEPGTVAKQPTPQPEVDQGNNEVEKLTPRARVLASNENAIPEIPLKIFAPFLARPLVIEVQELASAPILIGGFEQRVIFGSDDVVYAENLPDNKGTQWQVFRPGKTFVDPDTREVLGHEVLYLGDAEVEKFGKISQLRVSRSLLEMYRGDRLAQAAAGYSINYVPHAPTDLIEAKVISIYGEQLQGGQNSIITLNKGRRDGLESGHVLALYQKGEQIKRSGWFQEPIQLPDMRYGLVMVFRVFDKVSYALVMQTRLPVRLLDSARTP